MNGCTRCGSDLITIRMRVAERDLVFRRCFNCESNTWTTDAGVLSLDMVLDHVRAIRIGEVSRAVVGLVCFLTALACEH